MAMSSEKKARPGSIDIVDNSGTPSEASRHLILAVRIGLGAAPGSLQEQTNIDFGITGSPQ
jgi:hypothetical protein